MTLIAPMKCLVPISSFVNTVYIELLVTCQLTEIFIDTLSNNMGIGNREEVLMVTGFNGDLRLSQFCINKSYRLASYTTLAYKQAQLIN